MELLKRKHTTWIINILLVGLLVLLGFVLYWEFYPYQIIDWKTDHFETTKTEYVVGETLTYKTAFCKNGDYIAQQIRRLEDGVVYLYPELTSSTKEGCYDFIANTTEVPNVPSGEYYFTIEFVYRVNPLREVRYTMSSNKFTIINNGL